MSITWKRVNKGFWQVADPKIWIASAIPMFLGAIIAVGFYREFNTYWFLVAVLGVFLIEVGKNAINECIDYITGADPGVDDEHRTPFSGGKKTIVDGILTVGQSALIGIATMSAAAVIGLYVVIFREFSVIYIGLAGFLLAVIYSLPPFKLCYRGFGEIAVGLSFGPLILNGMYVVMTNRFDVLPLLVSLPIGFLIVNVLWINQFPDYETDLAAGKKNWVVRLGKKKAVKVYVGIFGLNYLSIIAIAIYTFNPIWLLALLTMPKAMQAVKNCAENFDNIKNLIQSNAATVQIYILTGVLLATSALLDGLII
ncbi:MAG: 1,4-dihydroxy-2-naphthoate octaprenyltransferase [Firmicutes bacterium HGW-Firmicutes-12]|jgi:1,4-dihydroxy-2-naphthoate octaprenyltransferase|nr:MAG: 1,4-dihydroxy-2-naphthoate octaprenyltransferase [Firmicutes bacterium HGW-Firmicutes-12]